MGKHPHSLVRPCAKCPFRSDIRPYLSAERVEQIEQEVIDEQKDFYCHATVDYSEDENEDDEESGQGRIADDSLVCAGMMILCEKMERPTQMMRISERLGGYRREKLDMKAPVFEDFDEMKEAQRR